MLPPAHVTEESAVDVTSRQRCDRRDGLIYRCHCRHRGLRRIRDVPPEDVKVWRKDVLIPGDGKLESVATELFFKNDINCLDAARAPVEDESAERIERADKSL